MQQITLIVSNRVVDTLRHRLDDVELLVYHGVVWYQGIKSEIEGGRVSEYNSEQSEWGEWG